MTRKKRSPPAPPETPRETGDKAEESWAALRQFTAARIGLPRCGASLATEPLLEFRLAHARARDAVHEALDEARLRADLAQLSAPVLMVASMAEDRQQYLMRPDLGRRLNREAQLQLASCAEAEHDVAFVIGDGLAPRAVQNHAPPLLAKTLPALLAEGWRIAPLVIARHARVAFGDAVAGMLRARSVAVLIGERPGLSAPDSMGAYLTWQPGPQSTDAERNCISNIRPQGIGYADAAFKLLHLLRAMRARRMSGVRLKDDTDRLLIAGARTEAKEE